MLELILRQPLESSVDVSDIVRSWTPAMTSEKVGRQMVAVGSGRHALADLFFIRGDYGDLRSTWQGDLSRLTGLGAGLTEGVIQVRGNIGNRAGYQISGGTLFIEGSAADDLGCEMNGGTIVVAQSVGSRAGGCGSGGVRGMAGGLILIGGHAGGGLGLRQRRGTILVRGDVGEQAGFQMIAGTILVGGRAGDGAAHEMKRGTVLVGQLDSTAVTSPRFQFVRQLGGGYLTVLARLLREDLQRRLKELSKSLDLDFLSRLEHRWNFYSGDHLQSGLGELLVADGEL